MYWVVKWMTEEGCLSQPEEITVELVVILKLNLKIVIIANRVHLAWLILF